MVMYGNLLCDKFGFVMGSRCHNNTYHKLCNPVITLTLRDSFRYKWVHFILCVVVCVCKGYVSAAISWVNTVVSWAVSLRAECKWPAGLDGRKIWRVPSFHLCIKTFTYPFVCPGTIAVSWKLSLTTTTTSVVELCSYVDTVHRPVFKVEPMRVFLHAAHSCSYCWLQMNTSIRELNYAIAIPFCWYDRQGGLAKWWVFIFSTWSCL